MKANKLLLVLTIVVTGYFFTGCFGVDAKFYRIKESVMNHIPGGYYTDVELGVGPVGLSFANFAVKFSRNRETMEARQVLKEITKVQVGVYKNNSHRHRRTGRIGTFLNEAEQDLSYEGWLSIAKNVDGDSMTAIYLRPNLDNMIRDLLVITLERDELIIASVEGNFSQALASVISSGQIRLEM